MIVDSPGIGENESMESAVMHYVEEAAAFFYVIDITNAGGVLDRVSLIDLLIDWIDLKPPPPPHHHHHHNHHHHHYHHHYW